MLLKQQNSEGGGGEKSVIWPDCSEIKFSRKEKERKRNLCSIRPHAVLYSSVAHPVKMGENDVVV